VPRRSKWQGLSTEAVNPRSRRIDRLQPGQIVKLMTLDNRSVLRAIEREAPRIARAASLATAAFEGGGRLIFVGAGTSGRLGILEAAEMPPTFGTSPDAVIAIMAGGPEAVYRAREGAEDESEEGRRLMAALNPRRSDVVVGISASGITPFVRGALGLAKSEGASVVGLTCDSRSDLKKTSDVTIALKVGPEVIAGSSRLKAGTATKMVLNMLTTAAMVGVGKTYGNLMVDLRANSEKLRDRARRIFATATGVSPARANEMLDRARWDVKAAILMQLSGATLAEALSEIRREPRLHKLLGRRGIKKDLDAGVELKKRRRIS
jgi:N-acetylmuramic acid 6-phosphate etherase